MKKSIIILLIFAVLITVLIFKIYKHSDNVCGKLSLNSKSLREDFYSKEAMFYEKLERNRVQCQLCFRKCLIPEGSRGFCRNRENKKGILYSRAY